MFVKACRTDPNGNARDMKLLAVSISCHNGRGLFTASDVVLHRFVID